MVSSWRYKKFHVSVLLAWLCVGLLLGILIGQYIKMPFHLVFTVTFVLIVAVSFHSRRWFACLAIVLVGCWIGVARGSDFARDINKLDKFIGQNISVRGTISQDALLKNGSDLWQVQLTNIKIDNTEYKGEIFATVTSDDALKRGDGITFKGRAKEGFGNFRLNFSRAQTLNISRPDDPFLAARDSFGDGVRKVVPEPEASLGLGFLVGQKSDLPEDLTEQMKTVGLTHIIVASGYNLTILVRFARRGLARKSRYLALVGSLLLVAGFVLVSGFSPSMNRAAIVTILTLLAWYYGRKFHPVKLILYVAAASAFWYPSYLWSDLGWLLSFAAFTGVLVLAPLVTQAVYGKDKEPGAFTRLVVETLSAQVMTLPIIVAVFGYVPVMALVANVLVAPVIPFAMFFTFIAGIIGLLIPALAFLAIPGGILVGYVVAITGWLASPDWSRLSLQLPMIYFVVWYMIMLAVGLMIWRRREVDLLASSVIE